MVTQEQMEQYRTEGYFVADNPPPDLEELGAAGKRVKAKVRAGEVDVYTHWAGAGEPGLRPRRLPGPRLQAGGPHGRGAHSTGTTGSCCE